MTRTLLSSDKQEIVIGFDAPFCVIGERINPTGRKLLAAEMAAGEYSQAHADRFFRFRNALGHYRHPANTILFSDLFLLPREHIRHPFGPGGLEIVIAKFFEAVSGRPVRNHFDYLLMSLEKDV